MVAARDDIMILTGCEIEAAVTRGDIVIAPFDTALLNPNSYNYHLGDSYIEMGTESLDSRVPSPLALARVIPKEGLVLNPALFYLCNTFEVIGSEKYITSLIGKSSMGRLGLYLQISANLGHQGEDHRWTLEVRCVKPIRIYPRMLIGQVTFWSVEGQRRPSQGHYRLFDEPTLSIGVS